MAKKSERSLLLLSMIFVFACLLLGGGWRLVGCEQEDNLIPQRQYASIRTAISSVPVQQTEIVSQLRRAPVTLRMHSMPVGDHQVLKNGAPSDANGNVLATGTSYMRAVYQVFVLDDGFV